MQGLVAKLGIDATRGTIVLAENLPIKARTSKELLSKSIQKTIKVENKDEQSQG